MSKLANMIPRKGGDSYLLIDYIRNSRGMQFKQIDSRDLLEHTIAGAIDVVLDHRAECTYPEGLHFDKEHAIAIALVDLHRENVIDFKRIVSYVKQFQEHEKGDM
jgi:hypothetical protein